MSAVKVQLEALSPVFVTIGMARSYMILLNDSLEGSNSSYILVNILSSSVPRPIFKLIERLKVRLRKPML